MAITKVGSNPVASQSSAAASAQDAVNAAVNLTAVYEALISGKVTNGATGPTLGCVVNCYVSYDNTTFELLNTITAGVTNSGVYPFAFVIPDAALYAKIGFGGNTAQAVTVYANLHTLTAI